MNLSVEQIRMLAQVERDMESGKQPYVVVDTGRLAVLPDILEELGLVSGQRIPQVIVRSILEMQLRRVQAEKVAKDFENS